MTDILDKVDASLEEVEEQLLAEYDRVRAKASAAERLARVDAGIRNALSEVVLDLNDRLQHSGDRVNLSLVTERHEILYARIAVLRQLLSADIPLSALTEVHEGIEARRKTLERRVLTQRKRLEEMGTQREKASSANIHGPFDHRPTDQQVQRNRFAVTEQEEKQLEDIQDYLDNGIYSASRELAMLASLIRGGTLDGPAEGGRGRAVFEAKELTRRMPNVNKPARIKQEPVEQPPPEEAVKKRDIAQTPEEIRRKLAARGGQANAGKAVFGAKDIAHAEPREAPRQPRQETKPEPEAPRSGKATFASRDIEPAVPQGFYGRKKSEEDDKKNEEDDKPRTGRAVFEARDLSKTPFPKKD